MSTGPGPTRKTDGSAEASVSGEASVSAEASVDDVADLLVEDESHPGHGQVEQALDDGLDVMLETPGPALVSTFMPPPPAPVVEDTEERESAEEPGEETNLAYEDLLAKLVLPAKAPEPEPASLPLPESLSEPVAPTPPAVAFNLPSSPSFQIAPPTDERTLVTVNPLVAEEQEAAVREGRSASREQPLVQEDMHPVITEPVVVTNGAAKSRLLYLMLGGLLVLGGMILAVLVLKLLMPTPAPQPPVVIAPAPLPPPPAPPAHVEPLPPSAAPAQAPAAAVAPEAPAPKAAAPEFPAPAAEEPTFPPREKAPLKAHRVASRRTAHGSAQRHAVAPRASAAPAAKASRTSTSKKAGKSSGYADPFDN